MDTQALLDAALEDAQAARYADAKTKLQTLLGQSLGDRDAATIQGILGAVYAATGDHTAAAKELMQAAARNPEDASIASNLCNCLTEIGETEKAVAAGCNACRLAPDFAEAHNNLGNALKAAGDTAGAAASYRRALQINPGYGSAYNNLGAALYAAGDLDGAAAAYVQGLETNPGDARSHRNLAVILRDRGAPGDADAAIICFRRALEIAPDDEDAAMGVGEVLLEQGQHAKGLNALANVFGVICFDAGAKGGAGVSVRYGTAGIIVDEEEE